MIVDQLFTTYTVVGKNKQFFSESRLERETAKKAKQRKLAESMLMEDPIFRQARQFGQLLVEYNLTKAQVQQLFKDVEQGATAAGGNRTGLGKAKDATTQAIGSVQKMLASARKWVKDRPTYQAVDAEYNRAMAALGKAGGENGEANAIAKAIYKYRDAAKNYPRAAGLAKWAIITAAGFATGGLGGVGVAAGLAAIDSALKDKEIVDIVGDAGIAALVSSGIQGAGDLASAASDAPFMGGQQGYDEAGNFMGGTPGYDEAGNYITSGGGDQIGLPGAETGGGANFPATGGNIGGGVPSAIDYIDYTVKPGDVLSTIADDNYMSVQDLMQANPGITNADVLQAGQHINIPSATGSDVYANGVGTAADTAAKVASGAYTPNPRSPLRLAETVKYKILPVSQLIDHKLTVMGWALNESIGKKPGNSVHLTRNGVFTVIENVDRYRRAYLKEYIGAPTADYGHPTAPGAPASATAGQGKPQGWFGRGLDAIGRGVDKVGNYVSNVGHNVITKVTADKLNNMWNRAGEPYDSDRLYQLLTTEWGVPKEVVGSVYGKMGIPYTASATVPDGTPAPQQQQQGGAGIQTGATSLIDPETGKPYEKRKLAALHNQPAPAPAKTPNFAGPTGYGKTTMSVKPMTGIPGMKAPATPAPAPTTPGRSTAPAASGAVDPHNIPYDADTGSTPAAGPNDVQLANLIRDVRKATDEVLSRLAARTDLHPGMKAIVDAEIAKRAPAPAATKTATTAQPGFNATNVMQMPGMEKYARAPAASGAGDQMELPLGRRAPGGYAQGLGKTDPTAYYDKNNLNKKDSLATVGETIKQVKKMLETVQTRDDVNFIKKYINHEFDRLGMVNQLATVQRNHLIERVTQIAAGRRRDHAKQLAN